jgi:hypothetical protein
MDKLAVRHGTLAFQLRVVGWETVQNVLSPEQPELDCPELADKRFSRFGVLT